MSTWQCLIRLPGTWLAADAARAWAQAHVDEPGEVRVLHGVDAALTYLRLPLAAAPTAQARAAWLQAARELAPGAELAILRLTTDLPGASTGASAPWHYIVETDIAEGVEAELDAWYEQEHLPGLAGVPGTVRAQRFTDETGSPRHHACYDLHTRETFGSAPWLAVRASAWSDRVRPHFCHTRRTMFRVVA